MDLSYVLVHVLASKNTYLAFKDESKTIQLCVNTEALSIIPGTSKRAQQDTFTGTEAIGRQGKHIANSLFVDHHNKLLLHKHLSPAITQIR